jgi:hypothetical protein
VLSRDPRRRRRAQMRSAIREVDLVDELLTTGQRVQPGGGTVNDSLIEVIEFGLPYPPAVGDHEPIQLRAISTSERAIDRISKLADGVRTGPREHWPRAEARTARRGR